MFWQPPTLYVQILVIAAIQRYCLLLFFLCCPWHDASFLRKRWMMPRHNLDHVMHLLCCYAHDTFLAFYKPKMCILGLKVCMGSTKMYGQYQDVWASLDTSMMCKWQLGEKKKQAYFCAHIMLGIIWGFPNLSRYKQKHKWFRKNAR